MPWTQNYNPTGSALLSTLLAAASIVVLLGTLGIVGWSAPRAALAGLITALGVAIGVYGMPWASAAAATGFGVCFGLFPIGWIVLVAVFLYVLTVETGEFEKVKASVVALSPDRRVQALLIAYCFGAFLEGAAGFGTPVAISAALMIGAGFPPLYAGGLALFANTAPVAFGALGTPVITLANVTKLPVEDLSAMAGRQLPFFSLLVPAWMIWTMSGWRGLVGVWPAVVVGGGSFAAVQALVANYLGPTLVDVAGGLVSLLLLAIVLQFWQPREVWQFAGETQQRAAEMGAAVGATRFTRREIASAWTPWIILSVCVFAWGTTPVKEFLNGISEPRWEVPQLHHLVQTDATAIASARYDAVLKINWLSATGTGIFVAALLSAAWMKISPYRFVRSFFRTLHRLRGSLFTIACMLAIAYVTKYSGIDVTLGLAFTQTGVLYPFFAALLGWLGVALTGSDTSSNALFGNLQRVTAEKLGLNPILICAANSTGGVMGKMIDAQSIVVASAATGQHGDEGKLLRFVIWHSLALAALMGLLTLAQAYWLTWMVPK
ncbi:MAG: L-lactate permease [Pirellulales bacterium]|nr:L-lactate permease [Pirellulales bacterium]